MIECKNWCVWRLSVWPHSGGWYRVDGAWIHLSAAHGFSASCGFTLHAWEVEKEHAAMCLWRKCKWDINLCSGTDSVSDVVWMCVCVFFACSQSHSCFFSWLSHTIECCSLGKEHNLQGEVQIISVESLHQIHLFIFVLAIVHVCYSCITVLLGFLKVKIEVSTGLFFASVSLLLCFRVCCHTQFTTQKDEL